MTHPAAYNTDWRTARAALWAERARESISRNSVRALRKMKRECSRRRQSVADADDGRLPLLITPRRAAPHAAKSNCARKRHPWLFPIRPIQMRARAAWLAGEKWHSSRRGRDECAWLRVRDQGDVNAGGTESKREEAERLVFGLFCVLEEVGRIYGGWFWRARSVSKEDWSNDFKHYFIFVE